MGGSRLNAIVTLIAAFAALTSTVAKDVYCFQGEVPIGVVLAGTEVEVLDEQDGKSLIFSERHGAECWISNTAFETPNFIHPADLENVLRWETLVNRWIAGFPNLTTELVLSVVYKETGGNPHAVDQTGNDVRLVGQASVGLMGAIPRKHLPCYATLTGSNGQDEYGCQLYLGMFILNSAIQQAHELRVGKILPPSIFEGTIIQDAVCNTHAYDGSAVAWLRSGEKVKAFRTAQDGSAKITHAQIYLERYGVSCWVEIDSVQQGLRPPPPPPDEPITDADIEMGLWLFGCTLENVLADNCLSWGREAYSDLVLRVIMPEITSALVEREQ